MAAGCERDTALTGPRLAPPQFHLGSCAAQRLGVQGCRACEDVCPHGALSFTPAGPEIDPTQCERCGACSTACPVGALERAFAPDADLFLAISRLAGELPGAVLVCGCRHDDAEPEIERAGAVARLRLPCVQLVSDDLLLWAVASGFATAIVDGTGRCPNRPHVGPKRAVDVAAAVLRSRGERRPRVVYEERSLVLLLDRVAKDAEPTAASRAPAFAPDRVARRAALLRALPVVGAPVEGAAPMASPWRAARIDAAACTACGSCALLCPTGALRFDDATEALSVAAQRCMGCGLCERGCPEHALALAPAVPGVDPSPRLLHRPEIASCRRCGEALLPEALVARVASLLGSSGDATSLRRCERCKVESLTLEPAPAWPSAEPPAAACGPSGSPPHACDAGVQSPASAPMNRRTFLQAGAEMALGATALATVAGCARREAGADVRWGMVIDTARCVGCRACTVACKAENHTPPGVAYTVVLEEEAGEYPDVSRRFLPRPCMQCENSSCTLVCPTGATYHRPDGIVAIDYDRCIGCRYCMAACPYGARSFDYGENYAEDLTPHERQPSPEYGEYRARRPGASPIGNARKCTFCLHRLAHDLSPACAETCMAHAIHFGNLKDPEARCTVHGERLRGLVAGRSPMRLKEELGNEPAVYYLTP